MFFIIYLGGNVGLIVLHWLFSPGVYLWIENAPIPAPGAKAPTPAVKKAAPAPATKPGTPAKEEAAAKPGTPAKKAETTGDVKKRVAQPMEDDDFSWAM